MAHDANQRLCIVSSTIVPRQAQDRPLLATSPTPEKEGTCKAIRYIALHVRCKQLYDIAKISHLAQLQEVAGEADGDVRRRELVVYQVVLTLQDLLQRVKTLQRPARSKGSLSGASVEQSCEQGSSGTPAASGVTMPRVRTWQRHVLCLAQQIGQRAATAHLSLLI